MSKHYAVIYGSTYKKIYKFLEYNMEISDHYNSFAYPIQPRIHTFNEKLDSKIIWEGDLDSPLLEVDESIFIPELDTKMTVTERSRIVDGGYRYETTYVIKEIEDEDSKIKAHQDKYKYDAQKEIERKEKVEVVSIPDRNIEKKWYQFWK